MPQNGGGNGGSGNGGSGQSTVVKAAKAAKAKAAAKVAGARAAHLERIEQHAQWMAGGPRTQAEFEEHGKAAVQPALDYYTRRFNMVDGNMYDLKRAFRAAKVSPRSPAVPAVSISTAPPSVATDGAPAAGAR